MTSSPSTDDGLKFGEKIYFEDVNVSVVAKAPFSSSSSSSSGTKKGKGGVVHQGCQVEGCKVDLSGSKPYYSRHKVCAIHSKSPTVVVSGLKQRFCQQCSRFHQLPEFDQGKRSCRRRLAGHNERRRKPQPRSLLTSRFARLSSPTFGNNGNGDNFVMEFASYPKHSLRSSEPVHGNQTALFPYHANSETPSDFFLQSSVGVPNFSAPMESYNGVANSSCALYLLSNQSRCSRNTTPNVELNTLLNLNGTFMAQLSASSSQGAAIHQFPTASWFLKGIDSVTSSPEVVPDLGLGRNSQPLHNHLHGEYDVSQDRRYHMDVGLSRACESPHWSL